MSKKQMQEALKKAFSYAGGGSNLAYYKRAGLVETFVSRTVNNASLHPWGGDITHTFTPAKKEALYLYDGFLSMRIKTTGAGVTETRLKRPPIAWFDTVNETGILKNGTAFTYDKPSNRGIAGLLFQYLDESASSLGNSAGSQYNVQGPNGFWVNSIDLPSENQPEEFEVWIPLCYLLNIAWSDIAVPVDTYDMVLKPLTLGTVLHNPDAGAQIMVTSVKLHYKTIKGDLSKIPRNRLGIPQRVALSTQTGVLPGNTTISASIQAPINAEAVVWAYTNQVDSASLAEDVPWTINAEPNRHPKLVDFQAGGSRKIPEDNSYNIPASDDRNVVGSERLYYEAVTSSRDVCRPASREDRAMSRSRWLGSNTVAAGVLEPKGPVNARIYCISTGVNYEAGLEKKQWTLNQELNKPAQTTCACHIFIVGGGGLRTDALYVEDKGAEKDPTGSARRN